MARKRILFLLPGFNYGGTVFSTFNMITFLRKDYDISVLPMTYQGPVVEIYRDAGINLLQESLLLSSMMGRINKENDFWRKAFFVVNKILRKILMKLGIDYEMIVMRKIANRIESKHSFDYIASCQEGASTYFLSCFTKGKKIAWFRSEMSIYKTEISGKELTKALNIYHLIDKIVCVSQTTCNDLQKYIKDLTRNVISIHNIQNIEQIKEKSEMELTDFPLNTFVIISIGRMNPQKRFSSIPKIARYLKNKGCKFEWLIIGDGNAFGEYDKTINEIFKQKVDDCVKCIGSRLNPYPYIKKANLLVNTSYVEACPRVIAEAQILKTPCISADYSSAKEFIKNNINGFVDTIDNIAYHIETMISNKEEYHRIKENCNNYQIDNNRIYEQLKELFS